MKKIELQNEEQFIKLMNEIIIPDSTIGTHCIISRHGGYIGKFDLPKEERANLIMENGLYSSPYAGSKGIISTVFFHGNANDETYREIWDYSYNYELETYKVIIALPKSVNIDNEEYIIGDFPIVNDPFHLKSLEYERLAQKIEFNRTPLIPKEFIVGYVIDETENRELLKPGDKIYNKHTLFINEKYYSLIGEFDNESKEIIKNNTMTAKAKQLILKAQKKINSECV